MRISPEKGILAACCRSGLDSAFDGTRSAGPSVGKVRILIVSILRATGTQQIANLKGSVRFHTIFDFVRARKCAILKDLSALKLYLDARLFPGI
jgi:hypothetical protein